MNLEIKWDSTAWCRSSRREAATGDVLMFAWMNREALQLAGRDQRSHLLVAFAAQSCGTKGEESGHAEGAHAHRLRQRRGPAQDRAGGGIACHTGRHSYFFQKYFADGRWEAVEPV